MSTNTKTIINIKTDKVLKLKAQKVASQLGIPLSTAVNGFLRQMVRDKAITFSIGGKTYLTEYGRRGVEESKKDIREGRYGVATSAEDLIRQLKS